MLGQNKKKIHGVFSKGFYNNHSNIVMLEKLLGVVLNINFKMLKKIIFTLEDRGEIKRNLSGNN